MGFTKRDESGSKYEEWVGEPGPKGRKPITRGFKLHKERNKDSKN